MKLDLNLRGRVAVAAMVVSLILMQPSVYSAGDLPSDSELIAHFKTHRADFSELVAMYQKYGSTGRGEAENQRYAELLKRAGLTFLSEDGVIWLPDPYSIEAAEKARAMNPFRAYAHHGVILRTDKLTPRLRVLVWKDYFYVPVVPRIEQGRLWWPRSPYSGDVHRSARVFDSLDVYPADWSQRRPAECVFRQIEPQWFLRLCASGVS
jgi:hypothetical protein